MPEANYNAVSNSYPGGMRGCGNKVHAGLEIKNSRMGRKALQTASAEDVPPYIIYYILRNP